MNIKRSFVVLIAVGMSVPLWAGRRIVALRSSNLPFYDQAVSGFQQGLQGAGVDFTLEDKVMSEDAVVQGGLISDFGKTPPSLLLTLGTSATLFARSKLTSVPSIFCVVIDPGANNVGSGGVAWDLSAATVMGYINKYFPQFKKVGVIHGTQRNKTLVAEFKELKDKGAPLTLVEVPSMEQVERAAKGLVGAVDCLIMLPDPSLYTPQNAGQFIFQTLQWGLPLVATSPAHVKAGALAGVYADSTGSGAQAAKMAGRVLAGETPESIAVQESVKSRSAVNLIVAERLKVTVSAEAQSAAEQVIK